MRWRLLIEEFGPEIIQIPGNKNVVADCLSCLDFTELTLNEESFALDESEVAEYPLSYKTIMKYQQRIRNCSEKRKQIHPSNYVHTLQQVIHVRL